MSMQTPANMSPIIKNLMLPMLLSVFSAAAGSYVGANVTLAVLETRLSYIEQSGNRRLHEIEAKLQIITDAVNKQEIRSMKNEQKLNYLERATAGI